jgi:hypothetical protein
MDSQTRQWSSGARRGKGLILSSSLTVIENQDNHTNNDTEHSELSPADHQDGNFSKPTKPKMQLFQELRDSIPEDTRLRFEQAREKFSASLAELSDRLDNEPLSAILSEQASRVSERASLETEAMVSQVAESISETLEETKEALQTTSSQIKSVITHHLVNNPEPGIVHAIPPPEPNHTPLDIRLTEEIMSQNKKRYPDDDTELVPRIKAAVRQIKADIDADDSGDPPLSLVSRKAKEGIEQFIKNKRQKLQDRLNNSNKSEHELHLDKHISVVGSPDKKKSEEAQGVREYITANIPNCDQTDPELDEIVSQSAGTYYNDTFLIDDIETEDQDVLKANGWVQEVSDEKQSIWTKEIPEANVTLYKIFGSFDSISAVEFYNAQVNDQHRATWDESVMSLYVIDNITVNREIVYWATKFPFPLDNRDYVFERSHFMDEDAKKIEITSRSITHREKSLQPKFVRVLKYGSKFVIKANDDLYQKGVSYCLTYYDDCGMDIPNQIKNKLALSKMPEFLDRVRDAALYLGTTGKLYVPYPEQKAKRQR